MLGERLVGFLEYWFIEACFGSSPEEVFIVKLATPFPTPFMAPTAPLSLPPLIGWVTISVRPSDNP
jgi:hypothetical protein